MRIILYMGKGGVGKTSMAAATALRSAEKGHKTIVFSTDAAHSLADSFDIPLAAEPTPIIPNLWGQEMEVGHELDANWRTVQDWLAAVFTWRGMDAMVAEEVAVLPGMEELVNLLYVDRYHAEGNYDVMVVDCAPTGETLRLLGFPEVLRWWMEHLYPAGRVAAGLIRPLMRPLRMPFPEEKVLDSVEELYAKLNRMHHILTDNSKTSVRLVLNAEKMVIKEAQRSYTYLGLYGYHTDLVICNRLVPDQVTDGYFAAWKESQSRYYQMIEEAFSPLPILKVPLLDHEVLGLPMLRAVADILFGDEDPAAFFYQGQAQEVRKEDGNYVLSLALPFASKEEVSLSLHGDELLVQVGRYRRSILLPRTLVGLQPAGARFRDQEQRLEITFPDSREGKRSDSRRQSGRAKKG